LQKVNSLLPLPRCIFNEQAQKKREKRENRLTKFAACGMVKTP
jgi:hypothetical protein